MIAIISPNNMYLLIEDHSAKPTPHTFKPPALHHSPMGKNLPNSDPLLIPFPSQQVHLLTDLSNAELRPILHRRNVVPLFTIEVESGH